MGREEGVSQTIDFLLGGDANRKISSRNRPLFGRGCIFGSLRGKGDEVFYPSREEETKESE